MLPIPEAAPELGGEFVQKKTVRLRVPRVARRVVRISPAVLLRQRSVQLVLLVSAVTGAATQVAPREPQMLVLAPQQAFVAPALLEAKQEAVQRAWWERTMERESRAMTDKFLQKGYQIPPQLAADIEAAALKNEIDPQIAFGLVRAESAFRNSATSPVGAIGLTQLMPRTASWIEPGTSRRDLRDQQKNLAVGFKYLRYLIDRYEGDTRLALLAYNRGPGTVDRLVRRGRNPDNGYVRMVLGE